MDSLDNCQFARPLGNTRHFQVSFDGDGVARGTASASAEAVRAGTSSVNGIAGQCHHAAAKSTRNGCLLRAGPPFRWASDAFASARSILSRFVRIVAEGSEVGAPPYGGFRPSPSGGPPVPCRFSQDQSECQISPQRQRCMTSSQTFIPPIDGQAPRNTIPGQLPALAPGAQRSIRFLPPPRSLRSYDLCTTPALFPCRYVCACLWLLLIPYPCHSAECVLERCHVYDDVVVCAANSNDCKSLLECTLGPSERTTRMEASRVSF